MKPYLIEHLLWRAWCLVCTKAVFRWHRHREIV